jgi:hypothetical protein
VVAHKDVRSAAFDPVAMTDLVGNKIQYAIDARPALDKKVCYNNRAFSENRRDKKTRKEQDHEGREHEQDPHDIKLTKERAEQKKTG